MKSKMKVQFKTFSIYIISEINCGTNKDNRDLPESLRSAFIVNGRTTSIIDVSFDS